MERLFVYLTNLSDSASYLIVFGILVACGLGFPLPEDIPLIATGYLIWDETMTVWMGLFVTMAGVLIGDTILFYIGRRTGLSVLDKGKLGKIFSEKKVRRTRAYFRKYGDKIVFFARFVAGFRAVAFFMSGAMKMPYRRFVFLDGLAALLSVPVWIGVGWLLGNYLGEEITAILSHVKKVKTGVTSVIAIIVVVVLIRVFKQYQVSKGKRQSNVSSP